MVRRPTSRFVRWFAFGAAVLGLCLLSSGLRADTAIPKAPERWVTDTAGMISEATRARLDARLESYERASGHQVVAWIGRTLGGADLADFAVKTFKAWGIGRKGHDDGVLMLVFAEDHKIDIEVGYGLEGRLTDAASHRIIDEVMAPRLRAGDADGALAAGVESVLATIEGHPVATEPGAPVAREPVQHMSPLAAVALALLGILVLVLFVTHPTLAMYFLFSIFNGGGGFGGGGGGGGFGGGGGRSGGGGARGGW